MDLVVRMGGTRYIGKEGGFMRGRKGKSELVYL